MDPLTKLAPVIAICIAAEPAGILEGVKPVLVSMEGTIDATELIVNDAIFDVAPPGLRTVRNTGPAATIRFAGTSAVT